MEDRRQLATTELVGTLCLAQLRAFEIAARAVRLAPNANVADRVARFAIQEHAAYERLRTRLDELTDLPATVLDRHRGSIDTFFEKAPMDDWTSACLFFAVGLPLAADFSRGIAPYLDERTADTVLGALAGRESFEAFAVEHAGGGLDSETAREHARSVVADVIGRALTAFQAAVGETDALDVLLAGHGGEGDVVRRLVVDVLEQHRRRMHAIGLEDLD